jgi:hypothetical protein
MFFQSLPTRGAFKAASSSMPGDSDPAILACDFGQILAGADVTGL